MFRKQKVYKVSVKTLYKNVCNMTIQFCPHFIKHLKYWMVEAQAPKSHCNALFN